MTPEAAGREPDAGPLGAPAPAGEPLVRVRLARFPVRVAARATEHHEELMREFALLTASARGLDSSPDTPPDVPARLLDLIDALTRRFAGYSESARAERAAALARGEVELDLVYLLPPAAGEASRQLAAMLDEADEFCRSGDLLTLATPPEVLAFRRWSLDEVIRQLEGGEPSPWPGPWD